ncbi:MAG: hypothetical protein EOO52_13285 [Gammaproteobacteria bacterium]|nr:MAG: hypothetical protein EOO52_13285 [Gammaproteobacteria bacterium]
MLKRTNLLNIVSLVESVAGPLNDFQKEAFQFKLNKFSEAQLTLLCLTECLESIAGMELAASKLMHCSIEGDYVSLIEDNYIPFTVIFPNGIPRMNEEMETLSKTFPDRLAKWKRSKLKTIKLD